ncbi:MAG: Ser-Thr-rich GPI-anchored membrane family protein, partial [Holophaga sp.]|nr:Ser-Thr-rich GPI-anchored membrane family protein [Holophaga sp.]
VHSTQANSSGWLSVHRTDFTFANPANIGRWVCFEMEVQLNSPGSANGAYRLWIDDELKAERINLDLRGAQTYQMNEAMLDCYWNGGAPRLQSRFYDNFAIATTRIGLDSLSTLTITAPNGGETWRRGETRAITWTPGSVTGNVAIELVQNGTAVGTIAENIAATAGTFAWTVGRLANGTISTGTGCRIRIRAVSSGISTQSHPF